MRNIAGFLLLLVILFSSCAHQRKVFPEQNLLAETFRWYASPNPNGSCSISFTMGGKLIYVDPVMDGALALELPKADIILVTHAHTDHFSKSTIEILSTPETLIAGYRNFQKTVSNATVLIPGDTVLLGGLSVTGWRAYNISHERMLDYLAFTIDDGVQKVFISGDTDMIDDYRKIRGVDVAVYCMAPPYTLDLPDAVKLTKALKPAVIIPVHWVNGMEDLITKFSEKVQSRSHVRILQKIEKM